MKKIIFIILDKFANWELAYLSAALVINNAINILPFFKTKRKNET